MGLFARTPKVRVRLKMQGRIGAGWRNVDETWSLREGTTLSEFIARADRDGFDLSGALAESPHLAHTIMLNGERCPVHANAERVLADGDELFLLAPIAGG
ncbi:MAG: MoaD/ThiS family protein [Myxococcota bacterium]